MRDSLLLLALAGFSSCLQPGLHYKYNYFSYVPSDIPDLSHSSAGLAVKAEVNVFVENDIGKAVFKLNEFRMANRSDDLGCGLRGEIPDEHFHRLEDESLNAAVEEPFIAHLFLYEDNVIEHHGDDFKWLTNMRKGIASILKNEILSGNYGEQSEGTVSAVLHEGRSPNIFSVHEETVFGHCKADYSVYPLPEYLAGKRNCQLEETMEVDVQRDKEKRLLSEPKKNQSENIWVDPPNLEEDLWHVIRTVDFDHCLEKVAVQITTSCSHEDASRNQGTCKRGRASVAEYIFRGAHGKIRLERAVVEGATFLEPRGVGNQTLQLVSVEPSFEVPRVPKPHEFSETWMYQTFSYAETSKDFKVHSGESHFHTDGFFNRLRTFFHEMKQEEERTEEIVARITQDFNNRIQDIIKAQIKEEIKTETITSPPAQDEICLMKGMKSAVSPDINFDDIVYQKPTFSSSRDRNSFRPSKAIDRKSSTDFHSSPYLSRQWWRADLLRSFEITEIKISLRERRRNRFYNIKVYLAHELNFRNFFDNEDMMLFATHEEAPASSEVSLKPLNAISMCGRHVVVAKDSQLVDDGEHSDNKILAFYELHIEVLNVKEFN